MHGGTPIERAREEISKCRLLKEQARRTRERTFELLQALQESLAHTRRAEKQLRRTSGWPR
jgi:non-homologous end joining protein Ku